MARGLFITRKDITTRTPMSGNIDEDKYFNTAYMVQEIQLQEVLGTRLYRKLETDVVNGALTGNYLALVNNYVKDFVCWFTLAELIPFLNFQIVNGGVIQHSSETGNNASFDEALSLEHRAKDKGEHYGRRLYDYLSANNSLFPEWNEFQSGDMSRQGDTTDVNFVL